MIKISLRFPFLLIVSFISGCNHFHLHSHPHGIANDLSEPLGRYQTQTVIPDGLTNEWNISNLEFDNENQFSYTITNDFHNLYILLTTRDTSTKVNILNGGFTLLINPHGKRKAMASVYFPVKPSETDLKGSSADQHSYKLVGFKSGNGYYSEAQGNKAGIRLHLTPAGHHELVYEAIIPFSAVFAGEAFEIDGRTFSAGFSFDKVLVSGGHREVKIWRTFALSPK